MGDKTPTAEDCNSIAFDENCDGEPKCTGACIWSKRFGDAQNQRALGIAVDGAGNVVFTAIGTGVADFGGGSLGDASFSTWVVKLDRNGNHLWSKRFLHGSGSHELFPAVDKTGNVLLAGWFTGTDDYGGGPLISAGPSSGVVIKLDPGGNHLWSKRFGGLGGAQPKAPAVDSAGNLILTGTMGSIEFEFDGNFLFGVGGADVFLLKIDPMGSFVWGKGFGSPQDDRGTAVAVDAGDNIVIAVLQRNLINFGGQSLPLGASIAKFSPAGNHLWSRGFTSIYTDGVHFDNLVIDGPGSVYASGYFIGTVNFGGGSFVSDAPFSDGVLLKLGAAGNHLITRTLPTMASAEWHLPLAADTAGQITIGGSTGLQGDSINFGGGFIPGSQQACLARYDSGSSFIWSNGYGDNAAQQLDTVENDAQGNLLAGVSSNGTVDFGCGPLTSAGQYDIVIAKLRP